MQDDRESKGLNGRGMDHVEIAEDPFQGALEMLPYRTSASVIAEGHRVSC